jgi:predicted NBD/HSP70 family sugar kinase
VQHRPADQRMPQGPHSLRLTAKALPEHNRRHNRSLILQDLFHSGEMSRAELARRSGLTPVTVSDLVNDLFADGLIEDLGTSATGGVGKPATIIGLRRDAFSILSLDLSGDDRFLGAVVDLAGTIVARRSVPVSGEVGERAVELVLALVEELRRAKPGPVLGIGIGTPGIVDDLGVVRSAPNLGWTDVDLAGRVGGRFSLPVHVENDSDAEVLGAWTFGHAAGSSLMVVTIKHGVGAGIVLGGALVRGEGFAAGEIGHIVVDDDGERCSCGRRGCLELALAAPALRRHSTGGSDADRERRLREAGRALGIALAPIISALDLNEVILSGPAELLDGPLRDSALSTVRARTLAAVSHGLEMAVDGTGDLALLGAAVLVLSGELGVA